MITLLISFYSSLPTRGCLVEFAILTLDKDGKTPRAKVYRPAEIDALLQEYDLAKKDEDTVMRS